MKERLERAVKVKVEGVVHNGLIQALKNKTQWRYDMKLWDIVDVTREHRCDYMRVQLLEAVC